MDQYFEALEKAKNNVVLNIVEQIQCEGADLLEKGKRAQMGEIREWNGLKYQKTPNGWVPVKQQKEGASEKKEEKSAEKQERGQFNSGIDWSKAEKEYVECPSFKSNYDTGYGDSEEIKSIKLYEDLKGWEVIGNGMGQIVFEGKAGQGKKFKTKEAAIKAVEDAIKKTQKESASKEPGSKEDTHGVEKKVLDFLSVSSNKYNDISKVSIYKTPKGNWALQYEGKDVSTVNGSSLPEADLKAAGLLKEEKQLFNYEDAVRYIESKGVSCDPNTEIGEYVCDRLDEIEDEQISEDTLKEILKDAKKYSKEGEEEEAVETDRNKLSRSIYRVLDVNNIKVSEQEISDVLDAVADFVPEKMLHVRYDKSNPLSIKPYSDRAEEILNKYREHFDHWEGTEDMPDETIKRVLTEFLLFR